MVVEHEGEYPSHWAAMVSIAEKIGCSAHTLFEWVTKAEVDSGKRAGVPTDVAERLKALERENRELRQADEILRKASAYFAQAELDPLRLPSNDAAHRRNLAGRLRPFRK
jgi:transposase-like protein